MAGSGAGSFLSNPTLDAAKSIDIFFLFCHIHEHEHRDEVILAPYYHKFFTLPHVLNRLLYCNQNFLYSLIHRRSTGTLHEFSGDKKYLGAPQHHPDSSYLRTGAELPCVSPLHHFRRRSFGGQEIPPFPKTVLPSGQGDVRSVQREVLLCPLGVLRFRAAFLSFFLRRNAEFL